MYTSAKISDKEKKFIEALFNKLAPTIYEICKINCSNKNDIEDCLQNVCLVMLLKHNELINHEDAEKWVFRVAYLETKKMNELNKNNNETDLESAEPVTEGFEDNLLEKVFNPHTDQAVVIKKIMDKLPKKDKEIFYNRFIKKQSVEEISKMLKCNYSAAKTAISRTRKRALEIFDELFAIK